MKASIQYCFLNLILQAIVFQTVAFVSNHKPSLLPVVSRQLTPTWLSAKSNEDEDGGEELSMEAFQQAKDTFESKKKEQEAAVALADFDGYALRDVILEKWGSCWDLDFNRVDSFGFRKLYLNVMPFRLEGRGRFRHETELDYLCHLQAVVEILQKYNQLDYVLYQIEETNKKPRQNTSPIVAVPLRLDLTDEEVNQILNY